MKYSTEEKILISSNRPNVELEDIEISYALDRNGDESPDEMICFFSEKGKEAFLNDEYTEGFYITLHFKDNGSDYRQKYLTFNGFAQIMFDDDEVQCDYESEDSPQIIFNITSDKDGRFSLTVPFYVGKETEENEESEEEHSISLYETMKNHRGIFNFSDIVIGNQFVDEHIDFINGDLPFKNEKATVNMQGIKYSLANYDED